MYDLIIHSGVVKDGIVVTAENVRFLHMPADPLQPIASPGTTTYACFDLVWVEGETPKEMRGMLIKIDEITEGENHFDLLVEWSLTKVRLNGLQQGETKYYHRNIEFPKEWYPLLHVTHWGSGQTWICLRDDSDLESRGPILLTWNWGANSLEIHERGFEDVSNAIAVFRQASQVIEDMLPSRGSEASK